MAYIHSFLKKKLDKRGVVLYTGADLVPFSDNLWAVPVNYLWE